MSLLRLPVVALPLVALAFGCAEQRAESVSAGESPGSRSVASADPMAAPSATAGVVVSAVPTSTAPLPIATPQHPGDHPGSYSPNLAPSPWDEAAYRRDPAAYCQQFMPGRCHQTAMPAADVSFLEVVGPQLSTAPEFPAF